MTWHATPELLRSYADATADEIAADSLEAHLVRCEDCRAALAALADAPRHERVWAEIADVVDRPTPPLAERVLRRLGVGEATARVVTTTPALSVPWMLAVAVTLLVAALVAQADPRGELLFLALAPLAPVAGVAITFGPGADPSFELTVASPYSTVRLLLLRASAVLATTLVPAALAALALPALGWALVGWLVPALALTLLALAVGAWVRPLVASAAVTAGWLALVGTLALAADDRLAAFRAPSQVALMLVGAASAGVLAWRARLDGLEHRA